MFLLFIGEAFLLWGTYACSLRFIYEFSRFLHCCSIQRRFSIPSLYVPESVELCFTLRYWQCLNCSWNVSSSYCIEKPPVVTKWTSICISETGIRIFRIRRLVNISLIPCISKFSFCLNYFLSFIRLNFIVFLCLYLEKGYGIIEGGNTMPADRFTYYYVDTSFLTK